MVARAAPYDLTSDFVLFSALHHILHTWVFGVTSKSCCGGSMQTFAVSISISLETLAPCFHFFLGYKKEHIEAESGLSGNFVYRLGG